MTQSTGQRRLARNSIGLTHIVFFVVAAAAPMAAVVGATPPAFALGNGTGVPGAFLLAGALYLLFSVGFTAMSRYVGGAGAFYSYISRGLGHVTGIAAALLALLAYFTIQLGVYGLAGVYISAAATSLGVTMPWWIWAFAVLAVVVFFGRRNIAISGRILGICMIAEMIILLLLDLAVISHGGGPEGLTLAGFEPSQIFSPGLGVTMVFVLGSYVGFEATAIFGEEAHTPERTIPLATYVAVGLITVFYAFSSWAILQYYGPSNVRDAANANLDGFYFAAAQNLLGTWSVTVMNILLITSIFACVLSFHNTLNRYFYTLGREGLAWRKLGHVHETHGSPHVAGIVQTVLVVLCLGAFAISGADPYTVLFSWMVAIAVLCLVAVQILVSIAVMAFFWRKPNPHSRFTTLIAPFLSMLGLIAAFALISSNMALMTGSENPLVMRFPEIVVCVGLFGALLALWLKRTNPALYQSLGQTFD